MPMLLTHNSEIKSARVLGKEIYTTRLSVAFNPASVINRDARNATATKLKRRSKRRDLSLKLAVIISFPKDRTFASLYNFTDYDAVIST